RELPDGVVRSVGYIDNDGAEVDEIYEVALEMTKLGDTIRFDFNGSSPQAPSYINCTMTGLMCGLAAAVLPTMAYDIPWNAGLFKPIEVVCDEGLICNAMPPAAVSGGVLEAQWMVEMTAQETLSKLVACSETYRRVARPRARLGRGGPPAGRADARVGVDVRGRGAGRDHVRRPRLGRAELRRPFRRSSRGGERPCADRALRRARAVCRGARPSAR